MSLQAHSRSERRHTAINGARSLPLHQFAPSAISAHGLIFAKVFARVGLTAFSIDAQLVQAYQYVRAKRYAEAMEIARRLQRQRADSAQGFGLEGDVQMVQNKHALAAQAYGQALTRQKSARLIIRLHAAQSLAKIEASEKPLVEWLRDNPTDVEAREYLAGVYLNSGRDKDAIEQYRTLLKSDPKNPRALNNLAWMLQDQDDAEALDYARRAFQIKPDDALPSSRYCPGESERSTSARNAGNSPGRRCTSSITTSPSRWDSVSMGCSRRLASRGFSRSK